MDTVVFGYVRLNIFLPYWYARSICILECVRRYISAPLEITLSTPAHLLTPVSLYVSPFRVVL